MLNMDIVFITFYSLETAYNDLKRTLNRIIPFLNYVIIYRLKLLCYFFQGKSLFGLIPWYNFKLVSNAILPPGTNLSFLYYIFDQRSHFVFLLFYLIYL